MDLIIEALNGANLPKYETPGASGMDLEAFEDVLIEPGQTVLVSTGLIFKIPEGSEIQIRPRSGMSLKTKLRISNSPGTVDSDYSGILKVIIENTGDTPYEIKKGNRIAQAVLCPIIRANIISGIVINNTLRGTGGFGSTKGF